MAGMPMPVGTNRQVLFSTIGVGLIGPQSQLFQRNFDRYRMGVGTGKT
jgi:hypothetical protein